MDYKVLVTGSGGQLGSVLCAKMKNIFKLLPTSKNGNNNLHFQKLNITDIDNVNKVIKSFSPDVIINTAAITNVDDCETNKQLARSINVQGLNNLIKCSKFKVKIFQISTDYIFDGNTSPYNESSLPNPLNYYGKTKLEAENILIGSNHKYIIIRISTLFNNYYNNFFTWVYNSLNNSDTINVVHDQISNPSYVHSVCDAIIDMILLDGNGIYHYGCFDSISRYDFAIKIAKKFNLNKNLIKKISTNELNQIATRPLNTSFDCNKIKNTFDITLYSVNDIMMQLNHA